MGKRQRLFPQALRAAGHLILFLRDLRQIAHRLLRVVAGEMNILRRPRQPVATRQLTVQAPHRLPVAFRQLAVAMEDVVAHVDRLVERLRSLLEKLPELLRHVVRRTPAVALRQPLVEQLLLVFRHPVPQQLAAGEQVAFA
ncbi:hypothetical protein SB00610_04965 [Klebsiella quasipneumoniae subsp. similipneumoniae]|nr:hypothetical protein SB00610_04965 [Klebsiella quasipneumoniae subsp. similipneumoniae]